MQDSKSDNAIVEEALPDEEQNEGRIFAIDTGQSILTWVGISPAGRHNGLIRVKEGSVTILEKESNLKQKEFSVLNATIVIDMNSLEVLDLQDDPLQMERLQNHLKSEDFFNTGIYPEVEFELISFEPIEEDTLKGTVDKLAIINPTHIMKGSLTVKDKTLFVEYPVHADYRNLRFEASGKFDIDGTGWDISQQGEKDFDARSTDGVIRDIINIGFEIIARPAVSGD